MGGFFIMFPGISPIFASIGQELREKEEKKKEEDKSKKEDYVKQEIQRARL